MKMFAKFVIFSLLFIMVVNSQHGRPLKMKLTNVDAETIVKVMKLLKESDEKNGVKEGGFVTEIYVENTSFDLAIKSVRMLQKK